MNVILVMILAAIGCGALLVRLSPREMRRIADWLNARADSEVWFHERYQRYKEQRAATEQRTECPT